MHFLRSAAKRIIPKKYRLALRGEYLFLKSFLYIGNRFICPCCERHFRKFLPFGLNPRPNAQCPGCYSLERQRLLWLYLKNKTNFLSGRLRVLHFAPEYILYKIFRSLPNVDYISADIENLSTAMVQIDITNIFYEENSFDVILCVHVLEHIRDDRKALSELLRILKPGGWAILQSPMDMKRDKTFEDPDMSPEDRQRFFGQSDHVRIYGRDYKKILERAGFAVKVDSYAKELENDIIKRYGLKENEDIYFCVKPKV